MTAPAEVQVPRMLRPNDAARYIGVSRTKLFDLLRTGEIPSRLISPRVRLISKAACDAYAERTAPAAPTRRVRPSICPGRNRMTSLTITDQSDQLDGADSADETGVETVRGSQLRLGDVVDYPHGPATILGMWSPGYLIYALGPGSVAIRHANRPPRAIAGDDKVQVLLPRPAEAA